MVPKPTFLFKLCSNLSKDIYIFQYLCTLYIYYRSVGRGPAYTSTVVTPGSHRRTPSNSSATAGYPYSATSRRGSHEDEYWVNPATVQVSADYDSTGMRVRRLSRQSSYTGAPAVEVERPQTLELPLTPRTPMRSSLKNVSYVSHSGGQSRGVQGGSSSNGTPTNPTPPDSLSEEVFVGGTSSR